MKQAWNEIKSETKDDIKVKILFSFCFIVDNKATKTL